MISEVARVAEQHVVLRDFNKFSYIMLFLQMGTLYAVSSVRIDIFTYIFEWIGLVADGTRLAVDALPKRGREDLLREFLGVAETGWVNCTKIRSRLTNERIKIVQKFAAIVTNSYK